MISIFPRELLSYTFGIENSSKSDSTEKREGEKGRKTSPHIPPGLIPWNEALSLLLIFPKVQRNMKKYVENMKK